jgi:hypothetical protein
MAPPADGIVISCSAQEMQKLHKQHAQFARARRQHEETKLRREMEYRARRRRPSFPIRPEWRFIKFEEQSLWTSNSPVAQPAPTLKAPMVVSVLDVVPVCKGTGEVWTWCQLCSRFLCHSCHMHHPCKGDDENDGKIRGGMEVLTFSLHVAFLASTDYP